MNKVEREYFEWMYRIVTRNRFSKGHGFRMLLTCLNSIDYYWTISDDSNRAADGEEGLRWKFAYVTHTSIEHELDEPCSVLEMILAMAYRCEEIMDDAGIGDRTVQWFWTMISNLGLNGMTDSRFDERYVREVVDRFLRREFEPDGHGSLFVVRDSPADMRDVPMWTSMLWFLDTIT